MSPLIYIGLLIMLITIVSEVVFLINYMYIRLIKRRPAKIQKKLFVTFGIMMCGFIIFFLGTQKVFSSKEVASFEITNPAIEQPIDENIPNEQAGIDDTLVEVNSTELSWYEQLFSQENKEQINQVLNDTGQFVDDMITTVSDSISQLMN